MVRVAALCGHTVDVCARTYAHWIGGVDSEAAQVLEHAARLGCWRVSPTGRLNGFSMVFVACAVV